MIIIYLVPIVPAVSTLLRTHSLCEFNCVPQLIIVNLNLEYRTTENIETL